MPPVQPIPTKLDLEFALAHALVGARLGGVPDTAIAAALASHLGHVHAPDQPAPPIAYILDFRTAVDALTSRARIGGLDDEQIGEELEEAAHALLYPSDDHAANDADDVRPAKLAGFRP